MRGVPSWQTGGYERRHRRGEGRGGEKRREERRGKRILSRSNLRVCYVGKFQIDLQEKNMDSWHLPSCGLAWGG